MLLSLIDSYEDVMKKRENCNIHHNFPETHKRYNATVEFIIIGLSHGPGEATMINSSANEILIVEKNLECYNIVNTI